MGTYILLLARTIWWKSLRPVSKFSVSHIRLWVSVNMTSIRDGCSPLKHVGSFITLERSLSSIEFENNVGGCNRFILMSPMTFVDLKTFCWVFKVFTRMLIRTSSVNFGGSYIPIKSHFSLRIITSIIIFSIPMFTWFSRSFLRLWGRSERTYAAIPPACILRSCL